LVVNFLINSFLAFFDSEDQVVFLDDGCTNSSSTNIVLVNSDDTVVAGEAVFAVCAEHANLVRLDVNACVLNLDVLSLDILAPRGEVGHHFDRLCPLTTEKATRRVLKVDSEKKSIFLVEVGGVDIGVESQGSAEYLSECCSIELLLVIPVQEVVLALGVLLRQKLLECFQGYESLSLMHWQVQKGMDDRGVSFTFVNSSSRSLRHSKSIVNSRQLHLLQSAVFVLALVGSIHKGVGVVGDADLVVLVKEDLVRTLVDVLSDELLRKDVFEVGLHDGVLKGKLLEHVIKLIGKCISLFLFFIDRLLQVAHLRKTTRSRLFEFLTGFAVDALNLVFVVFLDLEHKSSKHAADACRLTLHLGEHLVVS